MHVTIDLFGVTKDIIGRPQLRYSLPPEASVQVLLEKLRADYPPLARLSSLAVAVNSEYAEANWPLRESDEIALIPPVSGG